MDPANLPATFFALLCLALTGGFGGLRRQDCLVWLRKLQRDDGSFGEMIKPDGTIGGGRDMRYCQIAAGVRWMLAGDEGGGTHGDINVDKLVDYVKAGQVGVVSCAVRSQYVADKFIQTYDGGISESSQHEAHCEKSSTI